MALSTWNLAVNYVYHYCVEWSCSSHTSHRCSAHCSACWGRAVKSFVFIFITHNAKVFDGSLLLNYQGVGQFEDQLYGQKYMIWIMSKLNLTGSWKVWEKVLLPHRSSWQAHLNDLNPTRHCSLQRRSNVRERLCFRFLPANMLALPPPDNHRWHKSVLWLEWVSWKHPNSSHCQPSGEKSGSLTRRRLRWTAWKE